MPEINDLPLDSYKRYAEDVEKQRRETLQFKDDRQVVGPAQIDVTTPSFPSEVKSLLGEDLCRARWSDFPALPETIARRSKCFSSDLIPSLGNQESLLALKQKLDNLESKKP
jgi:hypothetical protein